MGAEQRTVQAFTLLKTCPPPLLYKMVWTSSASYFQLYWTCMVQVCLSHSFVTHASVNTNCQSCTTAAPSAKYVVKFSPQLSIQFTLLWWFQSWLADFQGFEVSVLPSKFPLDDGLSCFFSFSQLLWHITHFPVLCCSSSSSQHGGCKTFYCLCREMKDQPYASWSFAACNICHIMEHSFWEPQVHCVGFTIE